MKQVALLLVLLALAAGLLLLAPSPPRGAEPAAAPPAAVAPDAESLPVATTDAAARPLEVPALDAPSKAWRGVVLDSAGQPLPDATVWRARFRREVHITDLPDALVPMAILDGAVHVGTDARGAFELPWAPPADDVGWAVLVRHPRGLAWVAVARDALLEGGQLGEIRLEPAGGVHGRVLAADGAPIADALVEMQASVRTDGLVRPADPGMDGLDEALCSTRTAADGSFALGGLPTCKVSAHVLARGHLDLDGPWSELPAGGDIDLGELRLERGGTVSGRVLDASGRPVAGAEVRATAAELDVLRQHEHGIHWEWSAVSRPWFVQASEEAQCCSATSGPDGGFEIGGLRTVLCSVLASAPGAEPAALGEVLVGAHDIELRLGATGTLRLRLLDDATGLPLRDATLVVQRALDLGKEAWDQAARPVEALGDGEFLLREACASPLAITLRAPTAGVVMLPCEGLPPGEAEDLRVIRVAPPARVCGRVLASDGQPLGESRVTLDVWGDGVPMGRLEQIRPALDADGRFDSGPLPAGHWSLRASAPGRAPSQRELKLEAGEVRDVGDVALPLFAHVAVTVVDGAGQPVSNAFLNLFPVGDEQRRAVAGGSTAADGRKLFDVEPQPLILELKEPFQRLELGPLVGGETRDVVLRLQPPAHLSGTVRDAQGPVAEVRVEFKHAGATPRTTSDAEGRWALDLPGGLSGRLGAWSKRGGFVIQESVPTTAGASQVFDLVLPSGVLRGRVVEASSGAPLAGVEVQGCRGGPPYGRSVRTDADGRFELAHLADGDWTLQATGSEIGLSDKQTVRLPDEAGREPELRAARLAKVAGTVRTAAGFPVTEFCYVYLLRAGDDHAECDMSEKDGRFEFKRVEPGEYQLAVGRVPGGYTRGLRERKDVEALAWTIVPLHVASGDAVEKDLLLPIGRP